uniref:Capping protein inhibiting regulator of actin dynamics n=1 Tax=Spermophilus dauricus TaxID=99837 RepID=A0A8C9QJV7_SPEDA
MGEQKVSRQFKQCHRTTSWAKSKLFSRLSSMFLRQLGKNIKFGQRPPNAIPMKKAGSGEASSEEDLFLASPMEIVAQQDIILSDAENKSSDTPSSPSPLNLPGAGSEMEEKVAPVKPSRPKRHFSSAGTIESVNLDAIPPAMARLDNSAAKHKLSVKPKNQRVSKKHRRLARDRQNEPGGLDRQPSLDQNGHPGEDKHMWLEEEPEPLDSEEEKRHQEDYWRELEAKCKRQKAEAAEKRRLEEQRQQALERRLWEENRRQELLEEEGDEEGGEEEELQVEMEKERGPGEGLQRGPEEQGCPEQEQREPEDAERLEAEERSPLQEEELRRLEAQRQEEEARRREQEERKRLEKLRQQQEEEKRRQELIQQEEMETPGLQEAPKELPPEEERQPQLEARRSPLSALQNDFEEKPEDGEDLELRRQRESSEQEQKQEAGQATDQPGKRGDFGEDDHRVEDRRESAKMDPPQQQEEQKEETLPLGEKNEASTPEKERKVEELRWQEVDERQTMPRPYTFQVSSGGRQILFPKVNLTPVTPAKDAGPSPAAQEPKAPRASAASHALPSTLSIPHTAILVTGAQLCGPAVNLNQIKDTACKTLLGLSEEKKHVDVPTVEQPVRAPGEPRGGGGKARPPQETQSSVTALAEWASIRSRILKNAESEPRGDREQARPAEEPTPRARSDSRGNLRKTPPVNAKFSIMPAWQKFADGGTETSKQNTEAESIRKRPGPGEETAPPPSPASTQESRKGPEKPEVRHEPADTTEGCKFAKDLPSFLVPSLPSPPQKAVHTESTSTAHSEATSGVAKPDPGMPGAEEKASPFGIKLRRTNYSLRFHCDQQAEQKKKKRHSSTSDSGDGGPPAGASATADKETEGVAPKPGPSLPQERKQVLAPRRDSADEIPPSHPPPTAQPGPPPSSSQAPAPEHDKGANKMSLGQKPALAPKPASQTPPPSPLSKLSRPYLVELLARRAGKPDSEPSELSREGQEGQESSGTQPPSPPPPEERKGQKREEDEEEVLEKKPSSPPLSTTLLERASQMPEAGRKGRYCKVEPWSLSNGYKITEKVETAQPLWITLALQKQKGFREQQATREERKQAREAKQAEKLSKENVSVSPQPGSGSVSRAGSLHKSTAQPEEKKPETAVSRLERREQLKKANTLPTSVTVEISDSAPPAPLVKEVTKRFSTPDAAPVSTEPAWLALAKRKAKAWSDCPQIIK